MATKNLFKKIVIYIVKIKYQWLDVFSMTIILFNITKFNDHDCMLLQYHDYPSMSKVMKIIHNQMTKCTFYCICEDSQIKHNR
jgi:hypothetical protein